MAKKIKNNFNKVNESIETSDKQVFKIVIIVIVFLALFYVLAALINGEIDLKKKSSYDYSKILASDTFNRDSNHYYVLFYDFNSNDKETIDNLAISLKTYKVNIGDILNSYVVSTKSNNKASDYLGLKINGATLIEIKKGKNVNYVEGINNISNLFAK